MGSRPALRGADFQTGSSLSRSSRRAKPNAPKGKVESGPRFSSFHCRYASPRALGRYKRWSLVMLGWVVW